VADERDALQAAEAAQRAWQAALAAAERDRQAALEALLDAPKAAAARQSAAAGARSTRAAAADALRRAEEERAGAASLLDGARGDWTDDQIATARRDQELRDRTAHEILERMRGLTEAAEASERAAEEARQALEAARAGAAEQAQVLHRLEADADRLRAAVDLATGGGAPASEQLAEASAALRALAEAEAAADSAAEGAESARSAAATAEAATRAERDAAAHRAEASERHLAAALAGAGLADEAAARAAFREDAALEELRVRVDGHEAERRRLAAEGARLDRLLAGRRLTPEAWRAAGQGLAEAEAEAAGAQQALGVAREALARMRERHERWQALQGRREEGRALRDALGDLQGVLRGGAFVAFVAEEQLRGVALDASARLGQLTHFRYALEVDAQGAFCVRDDWGGGARRPVTTLSGGETFLASLALALALSSQIQLRGRHPLQFFFLDEGFGTLDPEALDTAMAALERLEAERVHIGVISHVPEVRARLARRVIVEPAEPGGRGTLLRLEMA
jgi:exonuclease SbcC